MRKPRALDLFCCEGGASTGLVQAGFDVVGVDIRPQRRYPYEFVLADALGPECPSLDDFDLIWASPPCQAYSIATPDKSRHPDLLPAVRDMLKASGKPYIIENVPGAPMPDAIRLRGAMFGLPLYRERLFEASFFVLTPNLRDPPGMGYPCLAGNGGVRSGGRAAGRAAMGCDWMSWHGVTQAIPPAYSRFLASEFLRGSRVS